MPEPGTEAAYGTSGRLNPPQVASAGETLRPPSDGLPPQSAAAQYNSAYGLLRRADYPAAEEALRAFIQQHPNDPLVGNAQYWLGQSYYESGQFTEAATAFAEGYKRYPRGPKAPELAARPRPVARPRQSKTQRLHRPDAARPRFSASGNRHHGAGGAGEKEARVLSAATSARRWAAAEFADRLDRLADFEVAPLVAVAVSGGPDSLALALLADRWARGRGGRICALSVDHRLAAGKCRRIAPARRWLGGARDRSPDPRLGR